MPILDAAFAFALTMLLVATAVTQLVNLLKNTASLRCKEMQALLTECFQKEVLPVIELESKRLALKVQNGIVESLDNLAEEFDNDDLVKKVRDEQMVWMSTEEYVDYLRRTDLGRDLLKKLGDEAQSVFDELGKRYEAVGRKFSESFKKRSRWWSTGVALALAVTLNIDSIHIVRSYLENPAVRAQVVAQADQIVADYEKKVTELGKSDPGTAEAVKQAVEQSRKEIDELRNAGLPIGWSLFPYSELLSDTSTAPEDGASDTDTENDGWRWLSWILGVVLTGALAGLGAPFWFESVRGLSRIAQRAGGPKSTNV